MGTDFSRVEARLIAIAEATKGAIIIVGNAGEGGSSVPRRLGLHRRQLEPSESAHSLERPYGWYRKFEKRNGKRNK